MKTKLLIAKNHLKSMKFIIKINLRIKLIKKLNIKYFSWIKSKLMILWIIIGKLKIKCHKLYIDLYIRFYLINKKYIHKFKDL